jgi:hypothetical protein
MSKTVRIVAAILFVSAVATAQSTNPKNCSVDGSVVNSVTGAPILRAHVSLVGADDSGLAESDSSGKWSVEHMACGRVSVSANRVGFLRAQQNSGMNASLLLVAETPLHDVKLTLAPQAVLAGRVLDDEGDPILGAQVSLLTSRIMNGLRGIQASNSTTANDLGEYRFAGLTAGKYIVCANAGGGAVPANGATPYAERCYPGSMDAGTAMDVAAGYEGRIDFTLSPVATVHIRGVISGQVEGVNTSVNLIPRTQIARMFLGLSAQVLKDGTFFIRNVPPGSYTINATTNQQNARLTARAPVEVAAEDVEGIQLHLEPGFTVPGTVKIVSASGKKIEKPQYTAMLMSQDGTGVAGANNTVWDEARTSFTIPDVAAGSYRLFLSPPPPFYLKSAALGGRDIAGSEVMIGPGAGNIEVVLSDDGGSVEGDVSTDDGPVAAWIFLERDGAPSRNARTDASGHFKIDTVPPGDYKVYAWDDNTRVEYANPDWMQRNGKGVAVTVGSGQTSHVKLVRQIAPPE